MTLSPSLSATAPPRRVTRAITLVLFAMCAFAVMDGLTKQLSPVLPIPEIMWVRNMVFTATVAMLMRARGVKFTTLLDVRRPGLQLAIGLLLPIESATFMVAFRVLPIADVHAIAACAPLIVVALSVPVLGEQVGWRRWTAVGTGFLGVLLIVRPGFQHIEPPVLIALVGALQFGLYQVLVRLVTRTDRSETTAFWTAAIGLLATSLFGPAVWLWPDAWGWAMLSAIAVLGALAHTALIRALGIAEPSLLQPYNYTLFVWAVVVGRILFGAIPGFWTLVGAGLIIASGLYAWWRERLRAAAARAAAAT